MMQFDQLTLEQKLESIINNIRDKASMRKIIALLSGGKDSALALALAQEAGLNIKKIVNFTHRWAWNIVRSQLLNISEQFSIPLDFINFTEEIERPVKEGGLSGYKGIPCKFCKNYMFKTIYQRTKEEGCCVVLSGYSAMDSVARRIREHIVSEDLPENYMEFNQVSKYVDDPAVSELRPLIRLRDEEILRALDMFGIKVQRTHEANPQFDYWREGCPMQYIDRDIPITVKLLDESKRINEIVTAYAREQNIRASVLVPSYTVITFPKGHEGEIDQILDGVKDG